MQPGDEKLMQRVKSGDMEAFDILVRRWEHDLLNVIYRITGDLETAKDLRQEVFIKVYQAARRYRPNGYFKAWLYRIAINSSINELKRQKRRRTLSADDKQEYSENTLADANPQPDEIIQKNEMETCIQDALSQLPDEQRIVIVLRHYEGLKFQQIASILNCPIGTVKSRMHNGLDKLRTILKDFH